MKKCLTLLLSLAWVVIATAQTIEHVYHYQSPTVHTMDGFQQISLEGCLPKGTVGEPTLPWQEVSLILPQGMDASDITVTFSDFIELDGTYNLYPYQRPRTYSEDKVVPFERDEMLYRSMEPYPSDANSHVVTQRLNGVGFAFSGFTPMRYVPATGRVSYAQTVKVIIQAQRSRTDHSRKRWLTSENELSILRLSQNPAMLGTYDKRGRSGAAYDLLLITREAWATPLAEYIAFHNNRGIRTRLATVEAICNSMEGRDDPEKMRNYIIQEYENNGIMMVCLGGDVSIVPYRSLYCFAQEDYEDHLPADMYFACLDGTFNDDNDDRWGEIGEDDLLPELGIGRLCFNNQSQLDIILHKTFSYMQSPVLGEFNAPILGAEHLGDGYFGSDDLERLIGTNTDYNYTTTGYSTHYDFKKYYASNSLQWNATDFRNVVKSGGQYVHHVGHANTDYVAGWTGSFMNDQYFDGNNGVDHNFQLFHSHGCICGNFPSSCVLEKMITIPTGFVAATGNSRYGWYEPWGDGMAAHLHREFVDAYCNDRIPFISMALREAKIATAPFVTLNGEDGCMRWNIYCLNELGDPALCPWFEEPFTPNVVYSNGLKTGTTSTTVYVSKYDEPLKNFRVGLYHGDDLLGFGLTNDEGMAAIHFDQPLDVVGDMRWIVTGQSAWPQSLPVTGFENGHPYVFADIEAIDPTPDYGETCKTICQVRNVGDVDAAHIDATLSTDCEYVNITDDHAEWDNVASETDLRHDAFQFTIAENVPDMTRAVFTTTCDDGSRTCTTQSAFLLFAPALQIESVVIDDSRGNGNGVIDAGEEIVLHVNGRNSGHAKAPAAILNASCPSSKIQLLQNEIVLGDLASDMPFSAAIPFTSDADIVGGTVFEMHFAIHYGNSEVSLVYPFSVGYAIDTFESADFDFMQWDLGGDQPWFITDEVSYNGDYCARSGMIGDDEISSLILYIENQMDGRFSFYFKTSTASHDYLVFLLDGSVVKIWDKEHDWTPYSTDIKAGSHVIEFRYDKSPNGSGGSDCVWIDDVIFPPATIVTDVEEDINTAQNATYPNPNNGTFIVATENDNASIRIFDPLGQCIKTIDHAGRYEEIRLDDLAKGLYHVQIRSESKIETLKIIVN